MLEKMKIDISMKERDQFQREIGGRYVTINEFIKLANLDRRLFTSQDLRRLNPNDRIACERILAKLNKIKTLDHIDVMKSFQFDEKQMNVMVPWKQVEDGIYYDFGSEGKQMVRDQFNIQLLKSFFKVENDKLFPEEVVKAFKKQEQNRRPQSAVR